MASVTTNTGKRATTWTVRWRKPDGTLDRETFKRATDARAFRSWVELNPTGTVADWEASKGGAVTTTRRPADGPTIAALYALYVAGRDAGVTRVGTDDSLFRIQLKTLHEVPVKALNVSRVKAWRKALQLTVSAHTGRPYAPATIGAARTVLRAVVQVAVDDGIITANPVDSVDAPDVERPLLTADDVFTTAELEAFLKCASDRYRALFAVMGYTGCRLSEALGLTPALISLEGDGVAQFGIQRVQEPENGKPVLKPGRKTKRSERNAWLGEEVIGYLTAHLEDYPAGEDELIFRTETGSIPGRSNLLTQQFRPAMERAGIDKPDLDVMNLRHTAISHMLAGGMPVVNVAERVGHANPNETLRTYARFIPDASGTNPDVLRMRAYREAQK